MRKVELWICFFVLIGSAMCAITYDGMTFDTSEGEWYLVYNNDEDSILVLEGLIGVLFDSAKSEARIDSIMDSLSINDYIKGSYCDIYFVYQPEGIVACSLVKVFYDLEEVTSSVPNLAMTPAMLFDDPKYTEQYYLNSSGSSDAGEDCDIDFPEAVDVFEGRAVGIPDVVIAISDCGFEESIVDASSYYDDFTGEFNLWEKETAPGIGAHGFNFSIPDPYDPERYGVFDATARHGTYCLAVAAAVFNNDFGMVGVVGGDYTISENGCSFMLLTGGDPTLGVLTFVLSMETALDEGAKIFSFSNEIPLDPWSSAIQTELINGTSNVYDEGLTIFACAGDNDIDIIWWPAKHEKTICVGGSVSAGPLCDCGGLSTLYDDTRAFNCAEGRACYGEELDLVGPSTVIMSFGGAAWGPPSFSFHQGTSLSTPMVAGIAGLLLSKVPLLSPDDIKFVLYGSADKVHPTLPDGSGGYESHTDYDNRTTSPYSDWVEDVGGGNWQYIYRDNYDGNGRYGWNYMMGHGRLNAQWALKSITPYTWPDREFTIDQEDFTTYPPSHAYYDDCGNLWDAVKRRPMEPHRKIGEDVVIEEGSPYKVYSYSDDPDNPVTYYYPYMPIPRSFSVGIPQALKVTATTYCPSDEGWGDSGYSLQELYIDDVEIGRFIAHDPPLTRTFSLTQESHPTIFTDNKMTVTMEEASIFSDGAYLSEIYFDLVDLWDGSCESRPTISVGTSDGYAPVNELLSHEFFDSGREGYTILTQGPATVSGEYPLRIINYGSVYSLMDAVELKAIDHQLGERAIVDYYGNYFVLDLDSSISPISVTANGSYDISDTVGTPDGIFYNGEAQEYLEADFDISDYDGIETIVIETNNLQTRENGNVTVYVDTIGGYKQVGYFTPQETRGYAYVSFEPPVVDTLKIKLAWSLDYDIDFMSIFIDPDTITPDTFTMVALNQYGDTVTSYLSDFDSTVIFLKTNEYVDLYFTVADTTDSGYFREFFLESAGQMVFVDEYAGSLWTKVDTTGDTIIVVDRGDTTSVIDSAMVIIDNGDYWINGYTDANGVYVPDSNLTYDFDIYVYKSSYRPLKVQHLDSLRGNESWGTDIQLLGDVFVYSGDTLRILPGTRIRSAPDTDASSASGDYSGSKVEIIAYGGHIGIFGSEEDTVTFASGPGGSGSEQWFGIAVRDSGTCDISYASFDNSDYGVYASDGPHHVYLRNCLFNDTTEVFIDFQSDSTDPVLRMEDIKTWSQITCKYSGDSSWIKNLVMDCNNADTGVSLRNQRDTILIQDCAIKDCYRSAIYLHTSMASIEACSLTGVTYRSIHSFSSDLLIDDIFIDAGWDGMNIWTSDMYIRNSGIRGATASAIYGKFSDIRISNCSFVDNGYALYGNDDAKFHMMYSLIDSCGIGIHVQNDAYFWGGDTTSADSLARNTITNSTTYHVRNTNTYSSDTTDSYCQHVWWGDSLGPVRDLIAEDGKAKIHYYPWIGSTAMRYDCASSNVHCVPVEYPTIDSAIAVSDTGDTIHVSSGVFEERGLELNKQTLLSGLGMDKTIIDGENLPPRALTTDNLASGDTIWAEHFTIRNGLDTLELGSRSAPGWQIYTIDGVVMLDSVKFENCSTTTNGASGALGSWHGDLFVDQCYFIDNFGNSAIESRDNDNAFQVTNSRFTGNRGWEGGGIKIYSQTGSVIINSIFEDNYAVNWGGGIAMRASSNNTITGCTFYSNVAANNGGAVDHTLGSSATWLNSIFSEDSANGGWNEIRVDNSTYHLLYCNIDTSLITGKNYINTFRGNVDDNPYFWNTDSLDLHLTDSSYCIDAGHDTLSADSLDFDGVVRSDTFDIGAYEYYGDYSPKRLVEGEPKLPRINKLGNAYPNPFNSSISIEFMTTENVDVQIDVYSMDGRIARRLLRKPVSPGQWKTVWDGKDNSNRPVSSGVYLVKMKVDGKDVDSKSVTLIK